MKRRTRDFLKTKRKEARRREGPETFWNSNEKKEKIPPLLFFFCSFCFSFLSLFPSFFFFFLLSFSFFRFFCSFLSAFFFLLYFLLFFSFFVSFLTLRMRGVSSRPAVISLISSFEVSVKFWFFFKMFGPITWRKKM